MRRLLIVVILVCSAVLLGSQSTQASTRVIQPVGHVIEPVQQVAGSSPRMPAAVQSRLMRVAGSGILPPTCTSIWEVLNPLASCVFDPTQPLRDALSTEIQSALSAFVVDVIDDIASGLDQVFTWAGLDDPAHPNAAGLLARTPAQDSYAHPVVIQYWTLCRLIADSALALLIVLTGLEILLSTRVGRSYDGALDGLRHILLAALLANVSLPLIGLIIEAGNSLCGVIGGTLTLPNAVTTSLPDETVAHALFRLLYIVVSVLVLVQMLMRLAFLDLLIILAPLGLLCLASPRTSRWAHTWTRLFAATAIQQVLQLLALHVCSDVITTLPGLTDPTDSVVRMLVGCAGLLLVFRLPRLLGGTSALGPFPTVAGMASDLGDAWARRDAARDAARDKVARLARAARPGGPASGGRP